MDAQDCPEEQAVDVRSRDYTEQPLPFQRQGVWRSQEEEYSAEQVFWGWRTPQGEAENSYECCHAASARRVPVRTGPSPWHGPSDLGVKGVTRVPPAGWAEAPGEEPHTLPL